MEEYTSPISFRLEAFAPLLTLRRMTGKPLRVGVLGAGHLGRIHIQQWLQIEEATLVGFFDPNDAQAEKVIGEFGVRRFSSGEDLMNACDAIDIVAPTTHHFDLAKKALALGLHLFVEKPLANTLEEGRELVALQKSAGVVGAVGHVERFNPAFLALRSAQLAPMFIECHRLAQFSPRGTDVSVLLDLMIHDIDLVLTLVKSPVAHISASGVAVLSDTPDIANARIEFDNGCVANLTASRISLKRMRKMRMFQKDAYISVDFLEKRTEIVRMKAGGEPEEAQDIPILLGNGAERLLTVAAPEVKEGNAIRMELEAFARAALGHKPQEVVTFGEGFAAMEVAHQIGAAVQRGLSRDWIA